MLFCQCLSFVFTFRPFAVLLVCFASLFGDAASFHVHFPSLWLFCVPCVFGSRGRESPYLFNSGACDYMVYCFFILHTHTHTHSFVSERRVGPGTTAPGTVNIAPW